MRFLPDRTVVRAGQTVTWTNRDPETPHTVTFGEEPGGGPLGAFAPAGTDGPGHATLSAPDQAVNSGFIGAGLPAGTTFSATFTKPGTYAYICALHDELGMVGTVVVLP
jgi:plastocyanin